MTPKIALLVIAFGTALGWVGAILTVTRLSPLGETATLGLAALYASLTLALTGTFTIVNYFLRLWSVGSTSLAASLRQGLLLTFVILTFLYLQHLGALTWWDGLLIIAIALLVEFLFASRERPVSS